MELFDPGRAWTERREKTVMPSPAMKFIPSEYAPEWHFFNHGALFTYTNLTTDPVSDWFKAQPAGVEVLRQPFKKPLFMGLTAPTDTGLTWDHMLCAVRHEHWQPLWEFLGGIAAIDNKAKTYFQTFSGDLEILDPGFTERYSVLQHDAPMITVTVFCVDSNTARWEIRPPINVAARPTMVKVLPRPEVVVMARAVLSGDLEHLQYKDNPAFQPLLDKFKAIVSQRGPHEGGTDNTGGVGGGLVLP